VGGTRFSIRLRPPMAERVDASVSNRKVVGSGEKRRNYEQPRPMRSQVLGASKVRFLGGWLGNAGRGMVAISIPNVL